MKNLLYIYKIMFKYWISLIFGLIAMLGYALFSGISVVMAIPLLDYVFKSPRNIIIYSSYGEFLKAIGNVLKNYVTTHGFSLNKEVYTPYLLDLKNILIKSDPKMLLWIIAFSMLALILIKNIFFFSNKVIFANLRGKTVRDLRNNMFSKYLFQSLKFFNVNKVGDSLVRMVSDVNIVSQFFINSIFNLIQSLILLFIYLRLASLLNLKLFLISLFVVPVFSIFLTYLGKKIKKYAKRIQQQSSTMFSNVEETLNGIKIVKLFSRERYEMQKFKTINQRYFKFWLKSIVYNAFNVPISEINGTIIGIIILIIGGRLVLSSPETFSFGTFMSFLLAIFSSLHPLKVLTKTYADIKKASVSLKRISTIINSDSEIKESSNPISKLGFETNILFRNVTFSYNKNNIILKNINFEIKKGEKIAIVGASGAGKTTLINLLTRMYDTTGGEILIDGIDIKKILIKDLRSLFGVVTQEPILFNATIEENIRYGSLKVISENDVIKACKIAYADEFIEKYPLKYKHILDNKAANISGGQKQRLSIARAIVGKPPILIFDEATSALDTESEQKVQQALLRAQRNRTVIVIAHRLSTILSSDKILVMDNGKIICMGTHEELLKRCYKYQVLYKMQFALDE